MSLKKLKPERATSKQQYTSAI